MQKFKGFIIEAYPSCCVEIQVKVAEKSYAENINQIVGQRGFKY